MMATETEKAYMAGILDGEGSLNISHRGGRRDPQKSVSVANTSLELIDWIIERFGGRVYPYKKREGWKQVYLVKWTSKEDIGYLLNQIIDYMIIKRKLADIMLEYLESDIQKQNVLLEVAQILNRRGDSPIVVEAPR